MKQQLKQLQRQILAPQLRQSLFILSLPIQKLKEMATEELNKNPVLEELHFTKSKVKASKENSSERPKEATVREEFPYRANHGKESIEIVDMQHIIVKQKTLLDVLLSQLSIHANQDEMKIGQEIIGNIDENGYLKEPLEAIAKAVNVDISLAQKALKKIQEFEPKGVGARTLQECLLIQANYKYPHDNLLRQLIENHLRDIGKKKYQNLTKKLKVSLENIKMAVERLQTLNPKPGRNYTNQQVHRIIPDATVTKSGNKLILHIEEKQVPRLRINQQYKELLNAPDTDQKTKDFIKERIIKAQDFIRAIEQRQITIKKVIGLIVKAQNKAFKYGFKYLKPLKLQDIAQKLNLHQTTISRVVMDKYIKTPFGTIAMKSLFSSGIKSNSGRVLSQKNIKVATIEIIRKEDKHKPLNDISIACQLNKKLGINISRRTVAKYRKQLKILSSFYRRED